MTDATRFSVGDVVPLKSDGPSMVVENQLAPDVFVCVWFADGRKLNTYFRGETLRSADVTTEHKQRVQ